jgi:hypothetical protein
VPNADVSEIEALLVATALPAILWMRGRFVLHAAAVLMPGRDAAIAIAGPSGVGKSAALAQLIVRGAAVLADDSVSVAVGASGLIASGLPSVYFVRSDDSTNAGRGPARTLDPVGARRRHRMVQLARTPSRVPPTRSR